MSPNQSLTWPVSVRRSLDEAQRAFDELRDVIEPIQRSLEQAVADHPIKAVLLSMATGVFLGWLIKR
jgi:ElaB/YqjD/DUF883 family membrane-anchored ribosome-binding protein